MVGDCLLVGWFVGCLIGWLDGGLFGCIVGRSVRLLVGWLASSFVGWLVGPLVGLSFIFSFNLRHQEHLFCLDLLPVTESDNLHLGIF